MSEAQIPNQRSEETGSELAQSQAAHDSDDEPMVYYTPVDYASHARQERERRLAEGAEPESVIFQSELHSHIPRQEGEAASDFVKRYSDALNAMVARGVVILNDQCTGNTVPDRFHTADGRTFDLGPSSGATKGEYRQFNKWFSEKSGKGQMDQVPERFQKFEMQVPEES